MTTPTGVPHLHSAALTALLAHEPLKTIVARDAEMTPANLRELETSVRSGARLDTRRRVADALKVDVLAITCWCDRPNDRCRSVQPQETH